MDLVEDLKLSAGWVQLRFPKVTGKIRIGWTQISIYEDKNDVPLTLVVAWDFRNEKPVALLTPLKVTSQDEAMAVFGYYLERWGKEEGYRFQKTHLKLEQIRVLNFRAIEVLHLMTFLTYHFICLYDWAGGLQLKTLIDTGVKHFHPIETIKYRLYRVADWMRIRILEQRSLDYRALIYNPIG